MVDIKTPSLGESISDAVVARWSRTVGEVVRRDEVLVELETDKVVLEVCAPEDGTLASVEAAAGATVTPGTVLGSVMPGVPTPTARVTSDPPHQPPATPTAPPIEQRSAPSVEARSMVRKAATGGDRPATVSVVAARPRETRIPMSRVRQTIARRLKESQNTAAMLTTFNEVDMSALMAIRDRYRESFAKRHGVKLGIMSFFVKACVAALKAIPDVNSEMDGGDLICKTHYDIGVAVGTDRGLVVPVLRDADAMDVASLERTLGQLSTKAREGKLSMRDLEGGTFSISNGGVYGSLMSTPILNAPQSGILGMHAVQQRPVNVAGQIALRPMMYIALSYDHRVVDGRQAVTFLVKVKEQIEEPLRMLLGL